MIGVRMGHKGGIDLPDIFPQALSAKVTPGIDHVATLRSFEIDRSPGTIIARIARAADRAIASNHGHAHGGAGAEEGDGELRVFG